MVAYGASSTLLLRNLVHVCVGVCHGEVQCVVLFATYLSPMQRAGDAVHEVIKNHGKRRQSENYFSNKHRST